MTRHEKKASDRLVNALQSNKIENMVRKSRTTTKQHFHEGDKVVFRPQSGSTRKGEVCFDFEHRDGYVLVALTGDPFPCYIDEAQVVPEGKENKVTTDTEPTEAQETATPKRKKTPRKTASKASAGPTKRTKATRPAKKSTAKAPAPAKKAPAARKAAGTGTARRGRPPADRALENPWRENSNSWHMTEALKKGGKRSSLVKQLAKKLSVAPWSGGEYADIHAEIDKRLMMTAKKLENDFGFKVVREGRGSEAKVSATPPSRRPSKKKVA